MSHETPEIISKHRGMTNSIPEQANIKKLDEQTKPAHAWIDHKWWQSNDQALTVHVKHGCLYLNDDGSHKWRYITELQDSPDWTFVLRTLDESAELRLEEFNSARDFSGTLSLSHGMVHTTCWLTEDECHALAQSVQDLWDPDFMTEPEPRTIDDRACVEQIVGSINHETNYVRKSTETDSEVAKEAVPCPEPTGFLGRLSRMKTSDVIGGPLLPEGQEKLDELLTLIKKD